MNTPDLTISIRHLQYMLVSLATTLRMDAAGDLRVFLNIVKGLDKKDVQARESLEGFAMIYKEKALVELKTSEAIRLLAESVHLKPISVDDPLFLVDGLVTSAVANAGGSELITLIESIGTREPIDTDVTSRVWKFVTDAGDDVARHDASNDTELYNLIFGEGKSSQI